ncbi:MAG TPA: hypothetical protein V6C81_15875 [Planktothrix sp.]
MAGLIALVALAGVCLRVGSAFGLYGYADSDTCWLLAMGREIAAQGKLPSPDPFTFTLTSPIFHQWLSESLMYAAYAMRGLSGLLVGAAVVGVIGMVLLPLRAAAVNRSCGWAFIGACLAGLSAPVRCLVRPELLSCLFLCASLLLLQLLRQQAVESDLNRMDETLESGARIQIPYVACFAVISLLWCNMHSGFIAGIILLFVYAASFLIRDLTKEKQARQLSTTTKTALASLAAAMTATLLNPAGFNLWLYCPRLYFSPIRATIAELQPISEATLHAPAYRGFYWLAFVAIAVATTVLFRSARRQLFAPLALASAFLIYASLFAAQHSVRFTNIAGIILLVESCFLLAFMNRQFGPARGILTVLGKLERAIQAFYTRVIEKYPFSLEAICVTCTVAGANAVIAHMPPRLPQGSIDFHPPTKAVAAFKESYRSGRIFASAPIADMLEWSMPASTALFLDTRFDEFGDQTFSDYNTVLAGSTGCHQLLARYGVDWIFVTPDCKLVQQLKQPQWHQIYKDDYAVILRRNKADD